MNIFKILSNGDGSINEPNVSSLLKYLLDPSETHGLSAALLERFIHPLIIKFPDKFKTISSKQNKTVNLSNNSSFKVELLTEEKLSFLSKEGNYKSRHIDIVIEIFKDDELIYCIAIENKINIGSVGNNQLNEEFLGLVNRYSKVSPKPQISFIYLIPHAIKDSKSEFSKLEDVIDRHKNEIQAVAMIYFWGEKGEGEVSVNKMLRELLEKEAFGDIEPLNEIIKYIIKSFKNFITADFKSYYEEKSDSKEKQNYGKPVFEFLQDVASKYDFERIITKGELRKEFENIVREKSGKILDQGTRDAKINIGIVNEKSRVHYGVRNPNDMGKNLFYYPDPLKKDEVKRIDLDNIPVDLKVYWSSSEEVKEAFLKEIIPIGITL